MMVCLPNRALTLIIIIIIIKALNLLCLVLMPKGSLSSVCG